MTPSPTLPAAAVSSDASLLAAARHDPDAFRELYERYAEAVHGYFVRRTGSRATAGRRPGAGGVLQAGTIVGRLAADRTDIGERSVPLLNTRLAQTGDYLRVAYGQRGGRELPLPPPAPTAPAGTPSAETDELGRGLVAASVRMRRAGVVVLNASFDPGWTATVDGRRQRTEMVAPALIATAVPAGTHRIIFRYRGWQDYPLLFAVGAATLLALAYTDIKRARDSR